MSDMLNLVSRVLHVHVAHVLDSHTCTLGMAWVIAHWTSP